MLAGMRSALAPCQPAWSSTMTTCSSSPIVAAMRVEEVLHYLGVGVRHDEGEAVVSVRFHGREDVGEREALVAQPRRALAASPPDVDRAPLLVMLQACLWHDPRLVLEEQTNTLVSMRKLNFSEQRRGSF